MLFIRFDVSHFIKAMYAFNGDIVVFSEFVIYQLVRVLTCIQVGFWLLSNECDGLFSPNDVAFRSLLREQNKGCVLWWHRRLIEARRHVFMTCHSCKEFSRLKEAIIEIE